MTDLFKNIPKNFLIKWQNIADLLAKIVDVPAALIMKTDNEYMEVFISSKSDNNPYHPGDKEHWHGLYCETVIKTQKELLVPDALKDENWDKNPDIKLGMIAYFGIPINFPEKQPFGTLCVLDKKENKFNEEYKALLYQFKNVIELDLALIQSMDFKNGNEDVNIIHRLQEQTEEYLTVNEELKAQNEEYYALYEEYKTQNEELFETKERIEISEAKYKAAFQTSPDSVNINKLNGEYVEINEGFTRLTGFTEKDVIGKLSSEIDIWSIPADRDKLIAGLQKDGIVENLESLFRAKDGTLIPALMSAKIISLKGEPHILSVTRAIVDRKKMEQDLLAAKEKAEESEERYRALYNNAPLSYQSLDGNGCFLDVNPMWLKTLGYERNEVIGKCFGEFLHPDYVEHFRINFPAFKKRGYVSDVQFKLRKKDNIYIYVSFEGCIGYTPEGKFKQTYCVFQDITEQKALEDELKEQTSFLSTIMETSPVGIVTVGKNGNISYANSRAEQILGLVKEEITSRTYDAPLWKHTNLDGSPFPDEKQPFNIVKKSLKTVFDIEHGITWPDGRVVILSINASPLKDNSGNFNGMIASIEDITERKQIELELAESAERFKALHNASFGGIVIHDKGLIIECNQGLSEITGYTYDELIGMDGLLLIAPDKREMVMGNIMAGYEKPYEAMGIRKNGELYPLRLEARNIPYKGKKVRTVEFRDIAESKQAEQQIIAAKEKAEISDRLKTYFLHNMSHEIRTPMNGIIGFSEMLDKPDLSEEKRKYYSKIVQNSSHQLLRIIDDILAISTLETKQEKLNETKFCLNDILMELFSIFNLKSKQRNIPLYLKKALHDNQSYIYSDKTKLNKILGNLLENALKFTSDGFIEFGYYIGKTNLILYVKDTGIGISSKNHKIIFERFAQEEKEISLKHGGLGLGLSICEENAKLLGGEITLESEKGKGSTFFVSIPYNPVQKEDNNTSKSVDNKQKINDKYTILVAEDEEVNYLYIEVLFEDEIEGNYYLIHAKNGKEAVEICMANNNINLVLMDIKMPILNGHEATEKIKEKFPDLPIIAQTAYSTESDKQMALKHGCNDFISKPINKEKLFGLMNKYLKVR